MNYDEQIEFAQSTDTGENNDDSVQPITNGESVYQLTINRAPNHLRKRTEVIKDALENLNYFSDYDRALTYYSPGKFTLHLAATSPNRYSLASEQDLTVYPTLSPGFISGGRRKGAALFDVSGNMYVGTVPNELIIVANRDYTGQRGFSNGDNLATSGVLSVGANSITIEFAPAPIVGGLGSISATVTGDPKRHIRIQYGTSSPGTTANQLVAFINGDYTSQGSYGLALLIRASTTTGTGTFSATVAPRKLQGGYDAEAYRVTSAQLASFFGTAENYLQEGDSLAISFPAGPVELGAGNKGGRRQSLLDSPLNQTGSFTDNTTPSIGHNLFNTAREPEKIPGSIPIGKLIGGQFIFANGTVLAAEVPLALGDSWATLFRLASQTGTTGSSLIGYGGSGNWNADAAGSVNPTVAASNLEVALDAIVDQLARTNSTDSGARRLGIETITGVVSLNNSPLTLSAGSLRQAFNTLLNTNATSAGGGGVNARVSERGHHMHDYQPLEKDFTETSPVNLTTGGATFLRAKHNIPGTGGTLGSDQKLETAFQSVTPLTWTNIGGQSLPCPVTISGGSVGYATVSLTSAQLTVLQNVLKAAYHTYDDGTETYLVPVQIYNANSSAFNGWYWITDIIPASGRLLLVGLANNVVDFTGLTSGSLVVYQGITIGNSAVGIKVRGFHVGFDDVPMFELGTYAQTTPILRLWDSVTCPSGSAEPTLMFASHTVYQRGGAGERDTNNILKTGDKQLLDGVEQGTAVDATASHHHGANYTHTLWFNGATNLISATAINAGGSPFTIGRTITPSEAIPAGTIRRAAILQITINWALSVGGAAGDVEYVDCVAFALTQNYNGPTIRNNIVRVSNSLPASGQFKFQMVAPLNNLGQVTISTPVSTNVNAASTTIVIDEVGALVSY
jgi:hypothetical protein